MPGSGGAGAGASGLIEGGLPTERLVAHVIVAKYADHCPLYRQAQILARQDIVIDRATLAFWTGYGAAEIKPVWRLMLEGAAGLDQAVRRRDDGAGARPRPEAHQEGILLGAGS